MRLSRSDAALVPPDDRLPSPQPDPERPLHTFYAERDPWMQLPVRRTLDRALPTFFGDPLGFDCERPFRCDGAAASVFERALSHRN